jgi:hypothetical protein
MEVTAAAPRVIDVVMVGSRAVQIMMPTVPPKDPCMIFDNTMDQWVAPGGCRFVDDVRQAGTFSRESAERMTGWCNRSWAVTGRRGGGDRMPYQVVVPLGMLPAVFTEDDVQAAIVGANAFTVYLRMSRRRTS